MSHVCTRARARARFRFCAVIPLPFRVLPQRHQVSTDYKLGFLKGSQVERLCQASLEPEDLRKFSDAIKEGFYFEFFVDDLPVQG